MFQPLLELNISDILNIKESHENLSKGKTPRIFITMANTSNKDIAINKGHILVNLHNVSATIPVICKKRSTLIRLVRKQNQVKSGSR